MERKESNHTVIAAPGCKPHMWETFDERPMSTIKAKPEAVLEMASYILSLMQAWDDDIKELTTLYEAKLDIYTETYKANRNAYYTWTEEWDRWLAEQAEADKEYTIAMQKWSNKFWPNGGPPKKRVIEEPKKDNLPPVAPKPAKPSVIDWFQITYAGAYRLTAMATLAAEPFILSQEDAQFLFRWNTEDFSYKQYAALQKALKEMRDADSVAE